MDNAVAQGQLGLAGRRRGGDGQQGVRGGGGVIGVQHGDALGVFVLGRADQRPGRGMRQIGCTVISADTHRVTGDDHQAAVGGVGPGQPALQLGQNVAGQSVHSLRIGLLLPQLGQRPDHQVRARGQGGR